MPLLPFNFSTQRQEKLKYTFKVFVYIEFQKFFRFVQSIWYAPSQLLFLAGIPLICQTYYVTHIVSGLNHKLPAFFFFFFLLMWILEPSGFPHLGFFAIRNSLAWSTGFTLWMETVLEKVITNFRLRRPESRGYPGLLRIFLKFSEIVLSHSEICCFSRPRISFTFRIII